MDPVSPERNQPSRERHLRHRWSKLVPLCVALSALSLSTPLYAEPSVEDVKAAGEQFNLGRTAFKDGDFSVAAEHFERADGLAPNPKVLLLAIQARKEAGQLARAAMLAEVANQMYPGDERFADNASIIERAEKEFARVEVKCDQPCNLVVDIRLIHGPAATNWVLFLEEGDHSVRAGFGDTDQTKDYTARAGEVGVLEFEAPVAEAAPPVPTDTEVEGYEPDSELFGASTHEEPPPPKPESKGLPPTWFWIGAGTTVALAGVSTWSAIDTVSNPGQDAVREGCQGMGTECPLYQQGLQRQSRTNVLWGVTGGVGVVTVVLFALTDWGSQPANEGEYSDQLAFTPWLLPPGVDQRGTAIGGTARGSF